MGEFLPEVHHVVQSFQQQFAQGGANNRDVRHSVHHLWLYERDFLHLLGEHLKTGVWYA